MFAVVFDYRKLQKQESLTRRVKPLDACSERGGNGNGTAAQGCKETAFNTGLTWTQERGTS